MRRRAAQAERLAAALGLLLVGITCACAVQRSEPSQRARAETSIARGTLRTPRAGEAAAGAETLRITTGGLAFDYRADTARLLAVGCAPTHREGELAPLAEVLDRAWEPEGFPGLWCQGASLKPVFQRAEVVAGDAHVVFELREGGGVLRELLATVTETPVRIDGVLGPGYVRRFRIRAERAMVGVVFGPLFDGYLGNPVDPEAEAEWITRSEGPAQSTSGGWTLRVAWMESTGPARVSPAWNVNGYVFDLDGGQEVQAAVLVWPDVPASAHSREYDAAIRAALRGDGFGG